MIEEIKYMFLDDEIGSEVKKGDVRRGIILSLIEHPLTVTQLAKTLKVSKPTVTLEGLNSCTALQALPHLKPLLHPVSLP